MKRVYDKVECNNIGAAIRAAGFRLNSDEVLASKVELNSRVYYVNRGVAYAAYPVQRGYWDAVNEASPSPTTTGLDLPLKR